MFSSFPKGIADGISLGLVTPPGWGPRVLIVRVVWNPVAGRSAQSWEITMMLWRFFTQTHGEKPGHRDQIGWNLLYQS